MPSPLQQMALAAALAQGSYALFTTPEAAVAAIAQVGSGDFSESEARRLFDEVGIDLRHHQSNELTGFSATVFFDRTSNKFVLGIRGTEGPADIAEDVRRIGIQGYAGDQLVSLYRYYRKLTTAAGQAVSYSDSEISMLQSIRLGIPLGPLERILGTARTIRLREMLETDLGISPIAGNGPSVIPGGAPIVVSGHSLGGHLALLFGRFFPEVTEHVYTFNAPGISPVGELALRAMGFPPSPPSLVTNVSAVMGEEAISRIWSKPGETVGIATEPGSLLHQHSIVPLTDTLALYEAFAVLSPGMATGVADISRIISAASPYPEDSLEVTLDALGMLLGTGSSSTLIARTGSDRAEREDYFQKLYGVLDGRDPERDYQIVSLAGKSAGDLASLAATNVGVRYALSELDAFAAKNADEEGADYSFSGQWLASRAELLAAMLDGNLVDRPYGVSGTTDNVLFRDIDMEVRYSMLNGAQAILAQPIAALADRDRIRQFLGDVSHDRSVVFGSPEFDNHLQGLSGGDSLFGSRGADLLEGAGGDDYLEGGGGTDELVGGVGDDTLVGGEGADRLEGGDGSDAYVYSGDIDADTIVDRDGSILVDGALLTGGREFEGGSYRSADGQYTYSFSGNLDAGGTLIVNDLLQVENFRNGDLGVWLGELYEPDDAPLPAPPVGSLLLGDYDYSGYVDEATGRYLGFDELGNPDAYAIAIAHPHRDDTYEDLPGTPGSTHFASGGGNDSIEDLFGGDDWLELGPGDDAGWGGSGNDVVEGGPGKDVVAGGRGDDILHAGTHDSVAADLDDNGAAEAIGIGDMLSGGDGADIIFGNAAANVIEGGAGDDRIHAGAGGDWIGADAVLLSGGEHYQVRLPNDHRFREGDFLLWGSAVKKFSLGLTPAFGLPRDLFIDDQHVNFPHINTIGSPADGGDYIDAGAGDDTIYAGGGDDVVVAGDGDDYIDPGTGKDAVFGGAGRDYIISGLDDDAGDDIDAGDGDDYIVNMASAGSRVDGGSGNDQIDAGTGADQLVGGDGDDVILSAGGDDVALGGAGDDTIRLSGSGDRFLAGGPGNDRLVVPNAKYFGWAIPPGEGPFPPGPAPGPGGPGGGSLIARYGGSATFLWGPGDGSDTGIIFDGAGILQVGGALAPGDVSIRAVSGNATGEVPIAGLPVAMGSGFEISAGGESFTLLELPHVFGSIDLSVRFADGTTWDDAYLRALSAQPETPAEPTVLAGTVADDFIYGGARDDLYEYAAGGGFDQIEDGGGQDTLRFAEGISAENVGVFAIENDYVLETESGGVRLMGGRTDDGAVEHMDFADGTRWTLADLEARAEVLPANRAPEMPESFGSVSTDPGDRVEFALPGDAVSDPDRFDAVNLYAITADGERLPGWLQFDAASRTLAGTPGQGDSGLHEILFIAADASGAAAAGSFTIQVGAAVPAPEPAAPVVQVTAEAAEPLPQLPSVEPVAADVAAAPTLPAPAPRENVFDALATINAALEAPRVFTDSAEPAFRDIQHRLDVLLQTGRTNLGERYAEAIREFEERRLEREEIPESPPPAEEEIEAWNSAMHAWHDRHQGFAETELGAGDGVWGMGWGLSGPEGSLGGAGSASLSSLANPNLHARLQGVASAPALSEGFQHLR
jgi:Ca2+-binding RTX toxin-like protein